MRDTTPEFERMYEAQLMALTPAERMRMCASMLETARILAEASFPRGLDETERRRRLCEHFYGKDLAEKAFPR